MKDPEHLINIAYVFLNVSQIKSACEQLFGATEEISTLSSFITNPTAITSFKCIVAKILLNISFHLGNFFLHMLWRTFNILNYLDMHPILLNDQFIGDIVDPFADQDDELSTEEMDKLPLQLQYVDHKRSSSTTLLNTLVEIMARVSYSS